MKDISIIYCRPCGYEKRAKDVASAPVEAFGPHGSRRPRRGLLTKRSNVDE